MVKGRHEPATSDVDERASMLMTCEVRTLAKIHSLDSVTGIPLRGEARGRKRENGSLMFNRKCARLETFAVKSSTSSDVTLNLG